MACSSPIFQAGVVGSGLAGVSAPNTVVENSGRSVLDDKSSFYGGNSTEATGGTNLLATRNKQYQAQRDRRQLQGMNREVASEAQAKFSTPGDSRKQGPAILIEASGAGSVNVISEPAASGHAAAVAQKIKEDAVAKKKSRPFSAGSRVLRISDHESAAQDVARKPIMHLELGNPGAPEVYGLGKIVNLETYPYADQKDEDAPQYAQAQKMKDNLDAKVKADEEIDNWEKQIAKDKAELVKLEELSELEAKVLWQQRRCALRDCQDLPPLILMVGQHSGDDEGEDVLWTQRFSALAECQEEEQRYFHGKGKVGCGGQVAATTPIAKRSLWQSPGVVGTPARGSPGGDLLGDDTPSKGRRLF